MSNEEIHAFTLGQQLAEDLGFLISPTQVGLQLIDASGRWIKANAPISTLMGFVNPDAMIGRSFVDHLVSIDSALQSDQDASVTWGEATLMNQQGSLQKISYVRRSLLDLTLKGHSYWTLMALDDIALDDPDLGQAETTPSAQSPIEIQDPNVPDSRSQFLANMSHEIRNPLNAIALNSFLLSAQPIPDTQKDLVDRIHLSSKMLLAVVDEILDFSKLEAGQVSICPRPFHLAELVGRIEKMQTAFASKKSLTFSTTLTPETNGVYKGDDHRIEQVLLNLVSNALKFTHEGFVAVAVELLERGENIDRIRFSVTDTGIGVESDLIQKLFKPYCQADYTVTRRYGGTGLGLAICHSLVELMGGNIGAESEPFQGSLFWFELPLERMEASHAPVVSLSQPFEPALTGLRFLVVEDDFINQEGMRMMLEAHEAEVTSTTNGELAVNIIEQRPQYFDFVLMDVQMPVMDGIRATRHIRDTLRLPQLKIIALTAGVLPHEQQKALDAGFTDLLHKPLDVKLLIELVKQYMVIPV